ncbi:MAG: flagellar hook assembly protein FlgD [Oxalicibacterium faecigallinarum]|uniref:Basal-body rod modification protein FlgD n=1 Tax=Oxalicibacterium faecigallinarum TaxID=573741 RepID=A0A8J3ATJ5_9BURK|nr:flagellar hook assembly protein FlgD [Oxalicibacterium faecigallinarum]MDQ7969704.1 flagellar hook assembly protein FlgD [Oxalicibacterium faecigallinarum]GGI16316.1 basal-body rod modification protein FlgD [Oxalicibacterium faecigallinarum]
MTTVSNTLPQSVLDAMNGTGTTTSKTSTEEAQDRFLKLLVTQMQNQDPLNPMDNAEVTSQMAQLSTVTGIDKLNSTLESLISSSAANNSLQAANLIGRGVLSSGNQISLADEKGIMGVEFSGPVDAAQVIIKDASGNVVHTVDLGAQEAGPIPLLWDGTTSSGEKAADGTYTFEVKATLAGSAVATTPLQFGVVTAVTTNSDGAKVSVPGLGALDVSKIRQVL